MAKYVIVCTLWAGSALLITIAGKNPELFLRLDIWVLFSIFFVCTLDSTVTADVRDIDGDKLSGIVTVPVLIGKKNTYIFLQIINTAAIVVFIMMSKNRLISSKLAMYAAFCILWAGITALPQYIKEGHNNLMEMLADSHLLISSAGLIVLSVA